MEVWPDSNPESSPCFSFLFWTRDVTDSFWRRSATTETIANKLISCPVGLTGPTGEPVDAPGGVGVGVLLLTSVLLPTRSHSGLVRHVGRSSGSRAACRENNHGDRTLHQQLLVLSVVRWLLWSGLVLLISTHFLPEISSPEARPPHWDCCSSDPAGSEPASPCSPALWTEHSWMIEVNHWQSHI